MKILAMERMGPWQGADRTHWCRATIGDSDGRRVGKMNFVMSDPTAVGCGIDADQAGALYAQAPEELLKDAVAKTAVHPDRLHIPTWIVRSSTDVTTDGGWADDTEIQAGRR